ncbi:hypothetical protein HZB60_03030 [candidate division KSB1 bacterium]|nr:hypothetical protein [candidate division KSB1 bacterium]
MKLVLILVSLLGLWSCALADERDLLAVDSAFVNGDYAQVELLALRLLQADTGWTVDARARVCLAAGYSLIMLDRAAEARHYFEQALDAVPDLTLDPVLVSPKFRTVFDDVKAAHVARRPREDPPPTSAMDRGSSTAVPASDALSPRRRGAVALNLLLPGAGHLRMQSPLRGAWWFVAEAGAVAFCASELARAREARQDYLRATDAADIERKYEDYNSAYRMSWISGGIAAAVYVASQLDLALVQRRPIALACAQQQGTPTLGLRIAW